MPKARQVLSPRARPHKMEMLVAPHNMEPVFSVLVFAGQRRHLPLEGRHLLGKLRQPGKGVGGPEPLPVGHGRAPGHDLAVRHRVGDARLGADHGEVSDGDVAGDARLAGRGGCRNC